MKKLFLSLILSLAVFVASAEAISNYKELVTFAKAVNKGADISMWQDDKGVVCLDADIDMKKGKKFPTIKVFNGKFDGCGHKFYNWNTQSSLFGTLETEAVVKNVIIDASCKLEVATTLNDTHEYVAYLVKINRGRVMNCINHGSVEHIGTEANREIMIGAIVACNHNIVYKCMNTGSVSCRTDSSNSAGGKGIRLGGLVGTCYGKDVVSGTTISYCVNLGNVSYMGDFPNNNIGGIVGESSRSTVKCCVNRGSVVAVGMPFSGTQKPTSRVGGISAWSNADIISCDNFGVIAASGSHTSSVGGICARVNLVLTMVDCVNRGKVSANTTNRAYVGGIFGETSRPIHVSQCYNYADVVSENTEGSAWCGGIAGVISLGKNPTGSYFRDCVNYGNIISKSPKSNSATGGFAASCGGYAKGNVVVPVTIRDCGNYGKISDATGAYSGDMCGWYKNVKISGSRYNDAVKVVKPLKDGTNIFGRVSDKRGMPIEGVVVSDGVQSVKTDVNGEYSMKSNMATTRFVMISVPAAYEMPLREQRPQFFRRVPRYSPAVRADFVLTKRAKQSDDFVLAMVGDPQTRGLKTDKAVERFRDVVVADINKYADDVDKDVYAIHLGDIVYNYMTSYDDYLDASATANVPMINVIGNHDYDQRNLFDTKLGTPYFESYIAPQNYSFNIGKMHFVVVNSILYDRQNDNEKYKTGLSNETMAWLESDLKHVPTSTTIVICSHAPLFKRSDRFCEGNVNYEKYTELLSKYANVYSWAGHIHRNYEYDYATAPEKYASLKNVKSIVVGRCIGMIRLNRELNTCGTPNGYMVAEVKGDKMEWYYKTVGHDRNYQMRVYKPVAAGDYLKVNIWNYSADTWSAIEWWENGVKVAEMEHAKGEFDPDYLKIYEQHLQQKLNEKERAYSKPYKTPYLFRVKPSADVREGEIRVTDHFGVTYTEKVSW